MKKNYSSNQIIIPHDEFFRQITSPCNLKNVLAGLKIFSVKSQHHRVWQIFWTIWFLNERFCYQITSSCRLTEFFLTIPQKEEEEFYINLTTFLGQVWRTFCICFDINTKPIWFANFLKNEMTTWQKVGKTFAVLQQAILWPVGFPSSRILCLQKQWLLDWHQFGWHWILENNTFG